MKRIAIFLSAAAALVTGGLALADTDTRNRHVLDAPAIADLIAERPVWCIQPSESGRSCGWAARAQALGNAGETGSLRVGLTVIVPAVGTDGRYQRGYTDYRFELDASGLCTDASVFADAPRRWVYTPHLQPSRVDGEVPIASDEQRERNALSRETARREHDWRGLMPGDRLCLHIARRDEGTHEFDITAVYAPGTPRESLDSPDGFQARTTDPGWLFGKD